VTICPLAAWLPVQNHGGNMAAHRGLILHVQEGTGGLQGWFNNPNSQVSATFWVSKGGALEQYVDADLTAWAQAAGNGQYNSVETEGLHGEALTDAQIGTLAKLYAWGQHVYGWPGQLADNPGEAGFGWHGMGGNPWGGHLGCPGDQRRAQRKEILALAGDAIASPAGQVGSSGHPAPPWPGRYIKQPPEMDGDDVRTWQQRMADRGWSIAVDGAYGAQSAAVCGQFQQEKGLADDQVVGPVTWNAAWAAAIS
jgi:hypothetical protein